MHSRQQPKMRSQQGAALVISLVILVGLTAIGISSMHNSSMQNNAVNNYIDEDVAFQAAEAALRVAERWTKLNSDSGEALTGLSDGQVTVIDTTAFPNGWWADDESALWSNGRDLGADEFPVLNIARMPGFVIESLGKGGGKDVEISDDGSSLVYLRITARGYGFAQTDTSIPVHKAIVQATYMQQIN